jgi:hypothetical protein
MFFRSPDRQFTRSPDESDGGYLHDAITVTVRLAALPPKRAVSVD